MNNKETKEQRRGWEHETELGWAFPSRTAPVGVMSALCADLFEPQARRYSKIRVHPKLDESGGLDADGVVVEHERHGAISGFRRDQFQRAVLSGGDAVKGGVPICNRLCLWLNESQKPIKNRRSVIPARGIIEAVLR